MSELQTSRLSANGTAEFSLCTFCNNSTNRFEKRLFATAQPKGPFFPILAELQGKGNKLDALGRAVVCVACFHHLLRQWSSFERRGVPIRKREYNIITEDRVTNYQTRREEEIRKEAELQIKEIQDREEKIRLEAEERFGNYQKRQADIRREAEKRLLEEQKTQSEFERDTSLKLKQEQEREDKLRRQAEGRIQEEKEKRDYIRQEAERLLREEKLIEAKGINSLSAASPNPQVVTKFRTEVIIQPPATKAKEQPVHSEASQSVSVLKEATVQTETAEDMESFPDDYERKTRTQRKKMMVYDPETGCYRKGNDDDDDKENFFQETKKTEKVEYRFRLRSDEKPWKHTEASDSCSRPDLESEDITMPMEPVQYAEKDVLVHTEKTIMLNGKEKSERKGSKDGDISDKDIKVAGDVIKARFDEGRERFEQEPFETRTTSGSDYDEGQQRGSRSGSIGQYTRKRTVSDDSLEDKIKEMEKRRERLLQRGSSGTNILQGKEVEVKPVEGEEPSPVPVNPRDGAMSPVEDTKKRQRSRQERNKRRLTAEELSLRKSIGDEEDTAKVTKTEKEEPKKRQEETTAWSVRPIGFDKREEEVFLKKEEPVEASNDLMTWEDVTDGPKIKDISSLRELPTPEFKDDTKSRSQKLVEIDLPIPVTRKEKEDNSTVTTEVLLDLDEDSTVSTTTTIESFSNLENRRRMGSNMDEDRRLREKEHEERKRRIEENQRRGAEELKAKKQQKDEVEPKDDDGTRETDRLSMKEKRRSLVDLWESFSETQPQVISFSENEIEPAKPIGNISTHETKTMVINPVQDNYETKDMEVDEDDNFDTRPSLVGYDVNHKLSEEERRWETAGNFQPGRLQKTVFHSLVETAPTEEQRPSGQPRKGSRYDWMKTESTADQAALVPSKLKLDWNSQEVTDVKPSSAPVIESSPERSLWMNKIENGEQKPGSESDSESSSDEERAPRVDVDEVHKLTEDEKQWESAGQFQPRKLNSALLAGFQQGPNEEVHKSAPRKGQGKPYEMLKKMHQTLSKQELLVPTKLTVKKTETSGESSDIRPVEEARTEAAPIRYESSTQKHSESESDSDDGVPEWRKVEERRRHQEQEEIERARQEERNRQELQPVYIEAVEESAPVDDEFEAKVRTKEIRKINPNLLFQFMSQSSKNEEATVSKDESHTVEAVSREEVLLEENSLKDLEDVDDEFEQKVKNRQVKKLVLDNSPFLLQTTEVENRVVQKQSPTESAQVSRTVHVREDVVVQRVDGEVVETQPAIKYFDAPEDEGFEVRIRAKDVKRLNKDQFEFLRREEEEAHRRLKEEERRQVEREEREMRRREEEQRRRLQAQVEAEEKEKVRLEEERRRREEQERNRREEQQRLRFEEAERLREEEEERLRREEEMEQLAREEMRKQKQAAQRKFQSRVFEDDDGVQWKNKETTSVGRLNLNMFATFQKASPDDAEPKARTHGKEQKMKEELKAAKVESETVVVQSVDVIESSPSTDAVEDSRREELEYEEKRKSVGKLDPAWYLKQQELQAAENKKRARELELERMKEEQYEIVKMKQETSLQEGDSATVTTEIENRRGKLSVDQLLKFQRETKEVPKRAKESQEQLITIESRDDVESIPQEIKYNEKRASRSYDDDQNYVILGRDSAAETQRNLRLQKEREEMDSFLLEEENEVGDKPKNVGKLDRDKLSLFQQESQDVVIPRRQELEKERKVQEVVIVQRQEQVESVPDETLVREEYHRSPTLTEEEMEYEQGIKSAKTLDVQKFLQSRNQEALEREQRKRQLAEDRTRQEKEEMLKLKEEEERKQVRSEREEEARKFSAGVGSLQRAESDSESSRSFLLSKNDSRTLESEQDSRDDRKISVGRLPKDLRSTFEGKGHVEVVNTRPQKKIGRSSSKYSIELSESSSGQKERYVAREGDINGNLTFEEKEVLEETPSIRKGSMKEAQYHDQVIASSTSEEKPVPKRLDLSMFTAFEQTDKQPVSLRRAKSEKQVRPKSVGNVDLLIWQDDAIINQPSAQRRKKESTERQPRPKSIAF